MATTSSHNRHDLDRHGISNASVAYQPHCECHPRRRRRTSEPHHHVTADAFGVLPPIARFTPAQAMYHDVQRLLWRSVHVALPECVRDAAGREDGQACGRCLAREYGLEL
jgi:hypothetical protein